MLYAVLGCAIGAFMTGAPLHADATRATLRSQARPREGGERGVCTGTGGMPHRIAHGTELCLEGGARRTEAASAPDGL